MRQSVALQTHETAVAWIRVRLAQTTPKRCWEETREQFRARLKHVVDTINATCDVAGLCRDLPKRVDALKEAQGGRIKR